MPTKAEQDELHTNCTWTWETQNGVYGYRVSSTANSNSIFLPAAGCRYLKGLSYVDSRGYYWSSSLYENSSNCAWYLYFDSSSVKWTEYDRDYGLCVRPVCQSLEFTSFYFVRACALTSTIQLFHFYGFAVIPLHLHA